MRIFTSGDPDVANWHIPIVQSKAAAFAGRCKMSGLSQNFDAYSFAESGVSVQVQYVFGSLSVHIHAPTPAPKEEPLVVEKKKMLPIWIKTHDEDVFGSGLGLFFSGTETFVMNYESSSITKTNFVLDPTANPNAILCCPADVLADDRLTLSWVERAFSLDNIGLIAQYSNAGTAYFVGTTVPNMNVGGFAGSCIAYTGDGYASYSFGGDVSDSGLNAILREEGAFDISSSNLHKISFINAAWMSSYCITAGGLTTIVPTDAVMTWPFEGEWTSGEITALSATRGILSDYIAYAFVGDVAFTMTDPNTEHDGPYSFVARSTSYCVGDLYFRIFNIDENGVAHQYDIPASTRSAEDPFDEGSLSIFERPLEVMYRYWRTDGKDYYYYWEHAGPYYPSTISAAPRNYISFSFTCANEVTSTTVIRSLAFDPAFNDWKPCTNDVTASQLWSTSCHECVKINNISGIGYNALVYSRTYDPITETYTYATAATILNRMYTPGWAYGLYPMKIILHRSGGVLSIKGAANSANDGIYRIDGGVSSKLHNYSDTEMEPVYVSHDGVVVATKTAIYNNGTKIVDCVECCGVYFDHTHYVDKVGPSEFRIIKIEDLSVVDFTEPGQYNFYELSDDSSVCVLSKYWMYEDDDKTTYPAMVVDLADPVYRFEISDVPLLQYMDEELFYPNDENKLYGYAGGVPFGARYNHVCECYCFNYSGNGLTGALKHYIYTTPPNGWIAFDYVGVAAAGASVRVRCLMCNQYVGQDTTWIQGELLRRKNRTVVAQYDDGSERRSMTQYNEKRLNCYVYHHTGKILRRREPGLTPLDIEYITETSSSVIEE